MEVTSLLRWTVFTRDGFTCQDCGQLGDLKSLEMHHINGNHNDNRYENLISLCVDCHLDAHGRNWKNKPVKTYVPKLMTEEIENRAYETEPRRVYEKRVMERLFGPDYEIGVITSG